MKHLLILLLAGLCFGSAAQAQQLYRCGNQYQKEPCADGKGKTVKTGGNTATATKVEPESSKYRPVTQKTDCSKAAQANSNAARMESGCDRPPAAKGTD